MPEEQKDQPEVSNDGNNGKKPEGSRPAQAQAPAQPAYDSSGEMPITRFFKAISRGLDNGEAKVVEAVSSVGCKIRDLLGFEKREIKETTLVKTPIVGAGHAIDGTGVSALRQVDNTVEPLLEGTKTAAHKVLNPFNTIFHPLVSIKDVAHIAASIGVAAKNAVLAPFRLTDEFIERSINNTSQQINTKIGKIPAIGTLWSKATNWVTGIAAKISNSVRETLDWAGSPFDKFQAATK